MISEPIYPARVPGLLIKPTQIKNYILVFLYTLFCQVRDEKEQQSSHLCLAFRRKHTVGLANTLQFMVKYSPGVSLCPSQLVIYQEGRQANNLLEWCYCNFYGVQLSKMSLCLKRPIPLIKVWLSPLQHTTLFYIAQWYTPEGRVERLPTPLCLCNIKHIFTLQEYTSMAFRVTPHINHFHGKTMALG